MKPKMAALLLTALPATVFGAGSSGTGAIQAMQVDPTDQDIIITGVSAWNNPDSCAQSSYVAIQYSNPGYKDLLATALAAATAGKTVNISLSGCITLAWGANVPIVTAVSVNF